MRRHELTDEQWAFLKDLLPPPSARGRTLTCDREAYRWRSIIECCIGWLKECRRIGTRFEKLAVNFLAMTKAAIIQRTLRILLPDRA